MSHNRDINDSKRSSAGRTVVQLSDLKKQIERLSGVRERIRSGFYSRPDVLAEIATRLSQRLNP